MELMFRPGQALLVVLLMLGVALTIGVSIASRSTTEVEISATQQEAARALEAAEAGLEKALGGVIVSDTLSEPVAPGVPERFSVSFTQLVDADTMRFPGIRGGDNVTVNLEPPAPTVDPPMPNDARVLICWGYQPTPGLEPAIEVVVYSRRNESGMERYETKRWAIDPILARRSENNFSAPFSGGGSCPSVFSDGSGVFLYRSVVSGIRSIAPADRPLYLQVRTLYNGDNLQPVAMGTRCSGCGVGGWNWFVPRQGEEIVSVGQAGSTTKKLKVTQTYFDPWPIFSDAVFSGSGDVGH